MERADFFECLIQKRPPSDLHNLIEFFTELSEYKAECSTLLRIAQEEHLRDKRNLELSLVFKRYKLIYAEMGSRLKVLTTQISAEKQLLILAPNTLKY